MDYVIRIFDLPYKAFPYMAKMYHSVSKPHHYPFHPYHHSLLAILCDATKVPCYRLLLKYPILAHAPMTLHMLSSLPKTTFSTSSTQLMATLKHSSQAFFFLLFIHLFRSIWTISYVQVLFMHWRDNYEQDGPYSQEVYSWNKKHSKQMNKHDNYKLWKWLEWK